MKTDDIIGAQSGTKVQTTKKNSARMVNPLDPQYNYPGTKDIERQYEDFIRNSANKTV